MADYTPNYNLKKPEQTDLYNIADHNGNADIIDTALNNKADKNLSNVTGTLPISKGGTGATTAANALSNLGVTTALSNKTDKDLSNVTGTLPIANGGTGATTTANALSNLGVTTALSNKADKDLNNVTGTLAIANGGTGATTAANALSNLGVTTALDNKADKDLSNVTGTLAITKGGTGATTAANALSNLGVTTALDNKADKDLNNVTGTLTTLHGGTGNTSGYIRRGQKSGTGTGAYSTCEGNNTTANAQAAHAEGGSTTASGTNSHAEGVMTTASGNQSHAEGSNTTASGTNSHAAGQFTTASGNQSHAEGYYTTASGNNSHAEGYYTTANYCQNVLGKFNSEKGTTDSYTSGSGYLIVGCGTSSSAKANCFRATESNTYGLTYNSSGADYAEMFEWEDGNISNEDRIGKFVTLDGDKIKLATSQDDYILGVVSGNPSIIGDSHDDQWVGMFEKDIYGRHVYEKVTIPEEKDEEGNIISPETINDQLKVSDKYKNDEEYIPRSKRPEWTAVGLLGKLICIDDGTAEINNYVKPNENAIATYSEEKTKYRVMKRIDETHIQIMIL